MAELTLLIDKSPPPPAKPSVDYLRATSQVNQFLRAALDQTAEGMMILEAVHEGPMGPKIVHSNMRMAAMVGVEPKAGLRGRYVTQLVSSKNEAEELIRALRMAENQGGAAQWEGDLKTIFGKGLQRSLWRIRAVQDEHGGLLTYTICITPSANAAATGPNGSARTQADAPKSDDDMRRLRNDNLAMISLGVLHDLNNLLGIMMTNLSVASNMATPGNAIKGHVDEALAAAQQAREFTTHTMRMAKDIPASREAADIADLIRSTARVAQSGSGVHLHLHLRKDLWWSVVDRSKITQVVQNLIINGIQAMNNAGYMDVLARNVLVPEGHYLLPPGPHLEILVRDRGCGMTPEVLSKVFNEAITTKANGNGIGLTTCKRVIEEHTGRIHVSSMKDVGTEITFWLPATPPRLVPALPSSTQTPLSKGKGTVLVVDDESRLRQVVVTVLKQCGYRVFEASSGEEAVYAYRHLMRHDDEVDLVLMDLTLRGGLTGEEALQEIKSLNPHAKVIASSGGLVEETRSSYIAIGFCDILPKPYLAPDIATIVHRHVMSSPAKPVAAEALF